MAKRFVVLVLAAIVATSGFATEARADHLRPARVLPGSLSVNAQFVSQWFYGVTAPTPAQIEANLATIAASGIGVVRTSVFWSTAEPNPPNPATGEHTYDWSAVNSHMTAFASHGIRPEPLLIGTPWWDSPIGAVDQFDNLGSHVYVPLHPEYFAAFAGAYAARYGRGGAFWAEHPELSELAPLTYEIWNEANLDGRMRTGTGSCPLHTVGLDQAPKHYTRLYVPARKAVRTVDSEAIVMVGGLTGDIAPRNDDRCTVQEFLAGMKAHDPNLVVDAIGMHIYRDTADLVIDGLVNIRRKIDELVWPAQVPLYLNESGWLSPPHPAGIPDAQRGAYLADVADRALRSNCGVREFAPHTWLTAEADQTNREHWYGIANINGTAKTSGAMYGAMVKHLQGDGPNAPNPASESICDWRGAPDIDGDGIIDSLDPYPADAGESVSEPVVPEAPAPVLLVLGALALLATRARRHRIARNSLVRREST